MKIYSKFEYNSMLRFQSWKDTFFTPLTGILRKMGISADFISILSGFVAAFSLILSFIFNEPEIFVIGIWFHFFLDGLDGSLARSFGKQNGLSGVATDLAFDNLGIITVGIYLWHFEAINPFFAFFFVFMYSLVNLISYIFAQTGKEYPFVIRPRLFMFLSITIDLLSSYKTVFSVVLILNALLFVFVIIGLFKLFKK
ncbi:MAG: CDP-alcohol phosphatidyltransferase family protein [Candidatus Parcubacteria bacterium]|nr:CDP-alcohol phosphatidyltransferase family protein [Candidatus Parcubacteria bacterium]